MEEGGVSRDIALVPLPIAPAPAPAPAPDPEPSLILPSAAVVGVVAGVGVAEEVEVEADEEERKDRKSGVVGDVDDEDGKPIGSNDVNLGANTPNCPYLFDPLPSNTPALVHRRVWV